ncbi:MAG: type III-B CRISPR module RAMP protein Cmr6 [Fervidobacterium sp.]|uniref:CRISPR-associated protein Cmr6 n=1 Tax=Fervidobacterium gondwanense DSM 13020 TaxID=1121883 RepID=A0A1M7TGH4_FERGO|nr:type III-B CRISPR module RAMP protein Cmr6 [Fervidobacterium gondwanense]SHN69827.1 CRISPR-associated protein Cmr6 [Fervidobacterium gondwanense DSM 13020]
MENSRNIANKGLYWNKLVYKDKQSLVLSSSENKARLVSDILYILQKQQNEKEVIEQLKQRRNEVSSKFSKVLDKVYTIQTKLLVGSGLPSPIEVGMTFSRNYGIPIIPSTSIKGTFANYVQSEKIFDEETYKRLFGTDLTTKGENIRGTLIFLDAIPDTAVKYTVDIVNNHFQPYYMETDNPPNDWYNPVPVQFIAVENTSYRFTILIENDSKLTKEEKEKIKLEFGKMLKLYGIGAKTNYGYGRFKD